ncbi:WG repeat-containing protein [Brevibacillus sp. TJ4]|uniref:WG repeat-containing protein n=1 Tax=Brevibacillus sp. TJ4 TaxID=3234853 RepID=UPI0037D0AA65
MNKYILGIGAAVLLLAQSSSFPVHAADYSAIQPFLAANGKIGFSNGKERVTNAIYDESIQYPTSIIVSAGGKKGILDARTGKQLTPVIWDSIDIPSDGNIAILQRGGWFQHLNLQTGQLSDTKFVGAHTYFLSAAYPAVIAMGGEMQMLLDPAGEILLPPFAGTIMFVDLVATSDSEETGEGAQQEGMRDSMRFVATQTATKFTLYDPAAMKPIFSLENARYLPQDGARTAYIRVQVGAKQGLVDSRGNFVLEPVYDRLVFWNHGYVRVESEQGVGLWKDGQMLAEPRFADVGIESSTDEVYHTKSADSSTVTYHTVEKQGTVPLKTGAEYLLHGYVLGQDPKTGLYGVVEAGGEVVIPFQYPRIEGPPAARLFIRSDGKKGLIPANGLPMQEPTVWFDTVTTLGTYSMLSIQDGKKIGLYSESKGLLLAPEAGRVIRHEADAGYLVQVTEPNGETLYFRMDGTRVDPQESARMPVTDALDASFLPGSDALLIERQTERTIDSYSGALYLDAEAGLVVGTQDGGQTADLYTPEGKPVAGEIQVPVLPGVQEGTPVVFAKLGEAVYTVGKKDGQEGWALVKLADGQFSAVSDFVYRDFAVRELHGKRLLVLTRMDGIFDLWALGENRELAQLNEVVAFQTPESRDVLLVKSAAGWDVYSFGLKRLSEGSYSSLELATTREAGGSGFVYQDGKTGLYGLLGADARPLTEPLYASIQATDQVFNQRPGVEAPPFVFTTTHHFGYLDAEGNELFRTERN